jgi:hypothetical protein
VLHPAKESLDRTSREEGREIDKSDKHPENAHCSIRESLEWRSNETIESFTQPAKEDVPMTSTEEGMEIEERDNKPEKAWWPIEVILEPSSKVMIEMPV